VRSGAVRDTPLVSLRVGVRSNSVRVGVSDGCERRFALDRTEKERLRKLMRQTENFTGLWAKIMILL